MTGEVEHMLSALAGEEGSWRAGAAGRSGILTDQARTGLGAPRACHSRVVIRVQDRHGRGPYRPGMSHRWSDPNGFDCPPWWVELGLEMAAAHERFVGPYHWGCAFTSREQMARWFNVGEMRALDRLGYSLAAVSADIVVAETPRQIVFGSIAPLSQPLRACRLLSSAAERLAA